MKLVHAQGKAAEEQAVQLLQQHGCLIEARNWHCRYGEIDIVARHHNVLLFVEVRYRKSRRFGGSAYSITAAKLAKMQRSAESYLLEHGYQGQCRIDAVLIEGDAPPQWLHNITG